MNNAQVSVRRYTAAAKDIEPEVLHRLMTQQPPDDGDFIVIRADPDRARSIENSLRLQLMPFGVEPLEVPR